MPIKILKSQFAAFTQEAYADPSNTYAGFDNTLQFNGSNYVDLSINAPVVGNAFTEELWLYPSSTSTGYQPQR